MIMIPQVKNELHNLHTLPKTELIDLVSNLTNKLEELNKMPVKSINVFLLIEMVDIRVLHKFDENHELLLKNLKIFSAKLIFSKNNYH